jgi:hypothetical protein
MDNVATRVLRKAEMEKELQQLLSAEAGINQIHIFSLSTFQWRISKGAMRKNI